MALATDEADEALTDELGGNSSAEERIGQVVGGSYRITRYLGSGGSSHVFAAEHLRLGKPFAVKLLRSEISSGQKSAQRFRREAKAIARLNHEHVVSVVDCGELEDRTPYLVMELLEGEDLRSLLKEKGRLPVRRAVSIVIEACRGLTSVHSAGLIHRDLKPENLFITRRAGGEDWCKILDFGVAKMESSLSTAQGAIVGTIRYMAPEQLGGGTAIGPPTDIYALAAILYECLAGKPLNGGETVQEVMYGVMNGKPEPLSELSPNLPHALSLLVAQAVSKSADDRPQTAAAFAKLLLTASSARRIDADSDTASDDDAVALDASPNRARRGSRRWLIPTFFAGSAGILGGLALGSSRSDPRPTPANPIAAERSTPSAVALAPAAAPSVVAPGAPALEVSRPAPITPITPITPSAAASPPPVPRVAAPKPERAVDTGPRRPAPRPPASSAPPQSVPVGNFDLANPYGE